MDILHNKEFIWGFKFFDKNKLLVWKIGDDAARLNVKTVVLREKEVIIGVVAKLWLGNQTLYTDFQFQITTR